MLRLDDAVDAIPVHLGGGILGMIGVGLFASPRRLEEIYGHYEHPGFLYSIFARLDTIDISLLAAQIVGILFILGWTVGIMLPFFVFLDYYGQFRVEVADEIAGLDHSFHGGVQDALNERAQEAVATMEKRLLQRCQGGS